MTVAWTIYCDNCGNASDSMTRFCVKCGKKLNAGRAAAACPVCGWEFAETDNYCGSCGNSLDEFKQLVPTYCRSCGGKLGLEARFCQHCGRPVKEAGQSEGGDDSVDEPATTIYGMPRLSDTLVVYGPPRMFGRR